MTLRVRIAVENDAAACAEIFSHYVLHTAFNLQEEPLPAAYFANLIQDPKAPFFVAEEEDKVIGYAYADVLRSRCGYRYAMEISVYVAEENIRRGAGGALMNELLAALKQSGMRAAVSFITLPNPQSVNFHERCGFAKAGIMPGVGWKFDRAHDVGIWVNNLV